MRSLRIGATKIDIHPDGLTVTRLPGGMEVHARPQDNDEYFARAAALGYGVDVLAMSREHEVGHALLAHWLGLTESPTMRGVASGAWWPHWQAEEAAVLGLQRYVRCAGVDLIMVAERG